MTERRKDLAVIALLALILLAFFSRILFTEKIIRAPDIINEFYWWVDSLRRGGVAEYFSSLQLSPNWDIYINSGATDEGGGVAGVLLHLYRPLLLILLPAPANVAWFIVLHLLFGGTGVYAVCRLIGTGRPAALFAALVFALAPETASLINAGHVIKIATICFVPWIFYALEKAFQTRRMVWFMATSVILAMQFCGGHWQVAFYTCLALGVYSIGRTAGIVISERREGLPSSWQRLLLCNLVVLFFFLSTVAMSLAPLANWSTHSNRGVKSGANQGKGGLDREEAMSWSLPPEELGSLVIPGFFGLSRQEGGINPTNVPSYYWGRMVFTQTASYMGLLPWLLLPLPLIFRRDRYTWLAVTGVVLGLLFSMGKFTPFYNLLYDYFPGINRFRVPKMIMFIPVFGVGVLAARGIDLLTSETVRGTLAFKRYLGAIAAVPLLLAVMLGTQLFAARAWMGLLSPLILEPNRFEQGAQLVAQRWGNMVTETGIAALLAAGCAGVLFAVGRRRLSGQAALVILVALFVADVWRINDKFLFTVQLPEHSRGVKTPAVSFIASKSSEQYRVLPMGGSDPMLFSVNKIPVMFTSNPVQQRRWQEYLDNFSLNSAMTDILNVKYLVFSAEQYLQEKGQLDGKYKPVFTSPDGLQIVLENQAVLPKAWLVPTVIELDKRFSAPQILQSPIFNPRKTAVVESAPPFPMAAFGQEQAGFSGDAVVNHYEGHRISLTATTSSNSLLVLSEKYYEGWKATVDGTSVEIVPVDHILRGVYLAPGTHKVEFRFDPLPFKVGKYLTIASFALFAGMLIRERRLRRKGVRGEE